MKVHVHKLIAAKNHMSTIIYSIITTVGKGRKMKVQISKNNTWQQLLDFQGNLGVLLSKVNIKCFTKCSNSLVFDPGQKSTGILNLCICSPGNISITTEL